MLLCCLHSLFDQHNVNVIMSFYSYLLGGFLISQSYKNTRRQASWDNVSRDILHITAAPEERTFQLYHPACVIWSVGQMFGHQITARSVNK